MARIALQAACSQAENGLSLKPTTWSVRRGECLALVGPHGCGASQLAQMVAGKVPCTEGQILLDGKEVTTTALASRVQIVGLDAITRPARPEISWWKRIWSRDIADQPSLSAQAVGAQVKTQLEQALARSPDVLVLDGCLCLLDPMSKDWLRVALQQNHDLAVVLVTTEAAEAMAFADRLAVMRAGEIVQVGPVRELYDSPQNSFVAGYLGTPPMNLISGNLTGGVFRAENVQVEGLAGPDGPAVLGFRAEDALWLEEDMGFTGCEISAVVAAVESCGHATLLHMKSGSTPVRVRVDKTATIAVGSSQRAILPPDICFLFHPTTGALLDGKGLRLAAQD